MNGIPIQQLTKSAKGLAPVDSKLSTKVDSLGVQVEGEGEAEGISEVKGNFSALFDQLLGKDSKKPSDVKSENGEVLKNLLQEKTTEKTSDNIQGTVIDLNAIGASGVGETQLSQKQIFEEPMLNQRMIEPKIASASSKLDQLLNKLKGTSKIDDSIEIEENPLKDHAPLNDILPWKKDAPIKGESKIESPLDFLMKNAKEDGITEKKSPNMVPQNLRELQSDLEIVPSQSKVMTADDFLNNKQSFEKKAPSLSLIKGNNDLELSNNPSKNIQMNTKNYGQGVNLLNDPIIKNTRDLTVKDTKKIKNSDLSINDLLTKDTKIGAELANVKQDVVMGVSQEKNNQNQTSVQTNTNQKVLNLSDIQTTNTNEIIKRISDYVEQNQVANKQSLDLNVKHDSLGEFKIQVSKMPDSMNRGMNQVDMQITTSSKEGHDFFVKNEVSLLRNLNQAGINLSDLRIVSSMSESTAFGQTDSRQSNSFSQSPDGNSKQFMNFGSSSNEGLGNGAERRKELWEEYRQRYGA